MRTYLFFLLLLIPFLGLTQKKLPSDSLYIKSNIFEIVYSEKLQQPKWIKYQVQCTEGTASRKGMDFYVCDSVLTSDHADYANNPYDKGHLAPAAHFNCTKDLLFQTFTYLNCSLQQENLNRTTWRLLEERERHLARVHGQVTVEVRCHFSSKSVVLPSGATVPDGYTKIIKYGNATDKYYFKNEKPLYTDYNKYKIK